METASIWGTCRMMVQKVACKVAVFLQGLWLIIAFRGQAMYNDCCRGALWIPKLGSVHLLEYTLRLGLGVYFIVPLKGYTGSLFPKPHIPST